MAAMENIRNIVILTGAGVSAESGIDTFRTPGGLWERYKPEEVATPEAFARDPDLVLAFYDMRRAAIQDKQPNAAHHALARLDAEWDGDLLIVTQNIDDLHERAGSEVLAHLHGSLFAWRCDTCHAPAPTPHAPAEPHQYIDPDRCRHCAAGDIRPGVVWFEEPLPAREFDQAIEVCRDADLVVVVGTSGIVQPAASLPHLAGANGIPIVEVDPRETLLTEAATVSLRATAAGALPAMVRAAVE